MSNGLVDKTIFLRKDFWRLKRIESAQETKISLDIGQITTGGSLVRHFCTPALQHTLDLGAKTKRSELKQKQLETTHTNSEIVIRLKDLIFALPSLTTPPVAIKRASTPCSQLAIESQIARKSYASLQYINSWS